MAEHRACGTSTVWEDSVAEEWVCAESDGSLGYFDGSSPMQCGAVVIGRLASC